MKNNTLLRISGLGMAVVFITALLFLPVSAQDSPPPPLPNTIESITVQAGDPVFTITEDYDTIPPLTAEQMAKLEWGAENSGKHPALDKTPVEIAAPMPGTESMEIEKRTRSGQPMAPGTAQTYIWKDFGSTIPGGYKSNVMESSTAGKSRRLFYTGNWFAAYSMNKGNAWTYKSAYSDFAEFCCDQVVVHDAARDIYIWLRQGLKDVNGENVFKLSVDFAAPFNGTYWTYTTSPTNVNSGWTNEWWDYPHMQLGADYLYIAYNMFDQSDVWTRTVMLRWPLDDLAAGTSFGYNYYSQSDWFTFVPVSGAHHTMYFASNWDGTPPYDSLRIWRWDEDSASLGFWTKTVTAWTATGRGDAHCGTPNWMARLDMRLLTGARYSIYSDGISEVRQRGRKVVGWWWNVAEGGSYSNPYIDAAAFYEDTMTQLTGNIGRPLIWSSDYCFAYPSIAPDHRQDLGAVWNYSTSEAYQKPNVGYSLADDYIAAPPGWTFYGAAGSGAGPSDTVWGDYNTVRAYQDGTTWIAGAHYIPGTTNCSNCSNPIWFSFGRERDGSNFRYW